MALRELGLPEADETAIIEAVDAAVELLVTVADRLKVHGMLGHMNALPLISESAKRWKTSEDRAHRMASKPRSAPKRSTTLGEASAPGVGLDDMEDVSHTWR
jgi:hypothetical protein